MEPLLNNSRPIGPTQVYNPFFVVIVPPPPPPPRAVKTCLCNVQAFFAVKGDIILPPTPSGGIIETRPPVVKV